MRARTATALLAALLAAGCGGGGGDDTTDGSSTPPGPNPVATNKLSIFVSGEGQVTSNTPSLTCRDQCSYDVDTGQRLVLTVEPADGYEFSIWNGDCTGTAASCEVVVDVDKSVRASFAQSASAPPPTPPGGNTRPVAKITGDNSVFVGTTLTLSGSTSSDADGDPLTYSWSVVSAPTGATALLGSPGAVTTTFQSDRIGTHVVGLVVNDGTENSLRDLFAVIVNETGPASDPDTVATLTVEKLAGSGSNRSVTFGSAFPTGALAAGESLRAYVGESAVPVQLDAKAYHRDGSIRHGIVTAVLPAMSATEQRTLSLRRSATGTAPGALSLGDLPASFDATVEIREGSQVYTASAMDLLGAGAMRTWLSGPLATEWHVSGDLVDGTGATHPYLAAHFYVRAFAGSDDVRVDVIVENAWTFVTSPRNVNYDLTIRVGGNVVVDEPGVTHYHQARWRKVFWFGEAPDYHVAHSLADLYAMRVVPKYDPAIVISESSLQEVYEQWASGVGSNGIASRATLGPGLIYTSMPAGGDRPDIGALPRWQVQYLLTMDARVKEAMLGTGDQAGSFPIHYRDRDTRLPVSIVDYPGMSIGNPTVGATRLPDCLVDCEVPYNPDTAHMPSLSFVPYLVTGDFFHLEEMLFWGTYINLYLAEWARMGELGLVRNNQVRGQAWSLRTLAHIDWILPPDHPQKTYWATILQNNIDYYTERYVGLDGNPPTDPNPMGVITEGVSWTDLRRLVPWMDDVFSWSMSYLVDLGYEEARPMLEFKVPQIIGRMTDPGFCWIFAGIYHIYFRDSEFAPVYDNYARLYEESVPLEYRSLPCGGTEMAAALELEPGEMLNWRRTDPKGFPLYIPAGLTAAVNSGHPDAPAALARFQTRTNPHDPSVSPEWALVPW